MINLSFGVMVHSHLSALTPQVVLVTPVTTKILVKDPMIVIFSTSEEVDKKTGEKQSRLNPLRWFLIFSELFLTEGENIWEIDARHVLQNNYYSWLKAIYYHTSEGTSKVRRSDGEVEITPTK